MKLYKIKEKYLNHMFKYANTKLNLEGSYTLLEWTKAGFKENVLELTTK